MQSCSISQKYSKHVAKYFCKKKSKGNSICTADVHTCQKLCDPCTAALIQWNLRTQKRYVGLREAGVLDYVQRSASNDVISIIGHGRAEIWSFFA